MKRSPAEDPQQGDVIRWKEWRVSVTRREGDIVYYTRKHTGSRKTDPEAWQLIDKFRVWAVDGKVSARGIEPGDCIVSNMIAGAKCDGCAVTMIGGVHIVDLKFFCEKCCTGHVKKGNNAA